MLPRPLILALAAACTLSLPAAAGTRAWTIDDVLAMRTVSDPQVSPDGRWVAYVVSDLNHDGTEYNTDIWLVSTEGGEARRLTNSPVADESPRWSPDGRTIAFLSDRPRPGAKTEETKPATSSDEAKRQAWLIRPDGGEASVLSDSKGGVSAIEWSRNGKLLGYLAREPKSEERKKKEKDKDDAWTPSSLYPWNRLWTMDVATRKATQLTSGEMHVTGFSLSPDGKQAVFAGQPTPLIPDQFNSDLYLIPTAGGRATPLVQRKGIDNSPAWSPDGKRIAFISQDGKTTAWYSNNYLCVVSPSGGPTRNLSQYFDERVQGFGGELVWTPDGESVTFQSNARTAQHLYRASTTTITVQALTSGPEVNSALSYDSQGRIAVFLREDGEHPREVVRVRLPDGEPEVITDTNPKARELLPFRKELVAWKGADGWAIEGLVIYPPGHRAGQKVPLVLNVHGGPAGTHSNTFSAGSRIYPWPLFAQKGYAILLPNPRGSGGYGGEFRAANVRDWGGKDYEDIMAGVDALIERGVADRNRLAVCGWSYGGFMTSTVVTKTDRFRAAVVGAGVTDLISMAGTCDIPEFNRDYFGSWPWEDPRVYMDHSAVLHAGNVRTPTLVVHGEKDDRVPPSQGWEFYTALRKVGVPTDLLLLPRQPHGPREPKLQRTVAEWTLDWINRNTLTAPPLA
ncbi:prolyl oligopeptidase family serine peptidase, partial [Actinokineospora sp.]|uniref:S9 family peptidase n=1 Tax=Actinokineospora sp. TaxID=1872133 RepID=UPI003D6BC7A2